jgi:hypothetical protein
MKCIRSRTGGIIVALLLAVVLAGCSTIKLGYSRLPELAYLWLDGYVDFSDEQSPLARQELARLHAWHRQHELPGFIELLARAEQLVAGPISAQQACSITAEVQARLNRVADQAEPAVVSLATSVTPAQLRHLERKYRRNNERFQREWIRATPAEQKEKRLATMLDRIEMVYGRLGAPQRAVLRQGIEQSIYEPQRVLQERQRRQQDLLQTLGQVIAPGVAPETARQHLRGYLQRAQHSPEPAYRAWQQQLLQESCRVFSQVHDSTTPEQRQQAARRLRAYQHDLRDLTGSH